jgi:hypothetical protein
MNEKVKMSEVIQGTDHYALFINLDPLDNIIFQKCEFNIAVLCHLITTYLFLNIYEAPKHQNEV